MTNETKTLLNANQNRSAIINRYNNVVENYDLSKIFSMIQKGFDRVMTNEGSNI
jgi:hypothetical protein|nr:MAG TPA: hypothetical protein [Caudoviricetes sp.]